jgi:hypothetical protein
MSADTFTSLVDDMKWVCILNTLTVCLGSDRITLLAGVEMPHFRPWIEENVGLNVSDICMLNKRIF